ncbi:hypothetical protein LJB42_002985 [Komagataella kurtzmanii]|nr:hypothetical protein LJB42_002985 [Komagataella kurtzmanii]
MLPIRLFKLLLLLSLKLKLGTAEEKYQKLDLKRINKDYYAVHVKVGSDEQEIKEVLIDTGSSDFWILDKPFCNSPTSEEEENSNGRSNKESCGVYGSFDSNESETFQATGQVFDAAYGDTTAESTGSSGVRGIDQLRIGDIHIDELYFGLVTNATSLPPVLGIAQLSEEFNNNSYPNFPYQMKKEGLIDVVAYSLSLGQSKGELLEGEKSLLDLTLESTIAGNIVIKVPFEDIIMKNEDDGECLSTVMVSNQTSFSYSDDTPFFVAGDEVLLNAYVVYNLETQELAIAPAVDNPEDTEEDIEIISANFDISEARDYSVGLEFRNTTLPATTYYLPSSMSSGSVSEETGSNSESCTSEDFAAPMLKPFTFWEAKN